jgi:DNA-binding NtrC family response regulator
VLKADVRIVAATNLNLENAVQAGTFREDLYYRLNVIHLAVPSLRERPEDVPLLVHHFLARSKEKLGRTQVGAVSRAAAQLLAEYHWPGNVRELENTIERAVLLCAGPQIEPRDLPQRVLGLGSEKRIAARLPDSGIDLRNAVDTFENQLIRQALERTQWNKKQAANLLGLNRTTLVEMLKRKRITRAA